MILTQAQHDIQLQNLQEIKSEIIYKFAQKGQTRIVSLLISNIKCLSISIICFSNIFIYISVIFGSKPGVRVWERTVDLNLIDS